MEQAFIEMMLEKYAEKDARLKMLLRAALGEDFPLSGSNNESDLVDYAIDTIAGLREDAGLLDDATSRANTAEAKLDRIIMGDTPDDLSSWSSLNWGGLVYKNPGATILNANRDGRGGVSGAGVREAGKESNDGVGGHA